MTKTEARERLAETWRFSRVGEYIALREVELIEAVRAHEVVCSAGPSTSHDHVPVRPSRSS